MSQLDNRAQVYVSLHTGAPVKPPNSEWAKIPAAEHLSIWSKPTEGEQVTHFSLYNANFRRRWWHYFNWLRFKRLPTALIKSMPVSQLEKTAEGRYIIHLGDDTHGD